LDNYCNNYVIIMTIVLNPDQSSDPFLKPPTCGLTESPLPEELRRQITPLLPDSKAGLTARTITVGEVSKFETAKKDAAEKPALTCLKIKSYGITDPDMLFEIFKIAFEKDPDSACSYIRYYEFSDQDLIRIVKLLQGRKDFRISKFIKFLRITDQKLLFEIAKIEAAEGNISKYIKDYGITDPDRLLEIGRIALAHSQWDISEYIPNYGFTGQKLFEFVKIAAASNRVSEHIKKYGITDPDMLFEIAKIAATYNRSEISAHIQNYGITDQDKLYEIAKIAAAQDGQGVAKNMLNYGITDPARRYEIAKIAAAQNGRGVSQFIENFGLTDQDWLFEIAKIAAAGDGFGTAQFIKKYGITDQKRHIAIAEIAVADRPNAFQEFGNFGITDQKKIFEMFKKCVAQHGQEGLNAVWHNCADYKMKRTLLQICFQMMVNGAQITGDMSDLATWVKEIANVFSEILPEQCPYGKDFFLWTDSISALSIPHDFKTKDEETKVKDALKEGFKQLSDLAKKLGLPDAAIQTIQANIEKRNSLQQQKKDMLWLGAILAHYALDPDDQAILKSPLSDENGKNLLKSIWKITNPTIRGAATQTLIDIYSNPDKKKLLTDLMAGRKEHLNLPILFAIQSGIQKDAILTLLTELNGPEYKETSVITPVLEMMAALSKTDAFSPMKKQQLLELIFHPPAQEKRESNRNYNDRLAKYRAEHWDEQRDGIAALQSLLFFNQVALLNELKDSTTLIASWKTFMGEFFSISEEQLPKFIETFCQSKRYPNGLPTFASRLMNLPKSEQEELFPFVGKFARAVLEESFSTMRNNPVGNKQLETIASHDPNLLATWKTSLPITLEETAQEAVTEQSPQQQIQKLLRGSIENHHIGPDAEYPELQEVLSGSLNFNEDESRSSIVARHCASILDPKAEIPQLKTALAALQKLFPDPASEFHHDLKTMASRLDPSQSSSNTWKIEDTDAWEDFLMMGTEVDGSCQHIQRNPSLNKCVLGYALDGKARLMIARDSSGKIIGRAVLRMLWEADKKPPVLFVEKLYTKGGSNIAQIRRDILAGCTQKAQAMGVTLTASSGDYHDLDMDPYPEPLHALGSPVPYEYVDALSGIQKNGTYTIPNSLLLWSPTSTPT
jgi:hypothetical protein